MGGALRSGLGCAGQMVIASEGGTLPVPADQHGQEDRQRQAVCTPFACPAVADLPAFQPKKPAYVDQQQLVTSERSCSFSGLPFLPNEPARISSARRYCQDAIRHDPTINAICALVSSIADKMHVKDAYIIAEVVVPGGGSQACIGRFDKG